MKLTNNTLLNQCTSKIYKKPFKKDGSLINNNKGISNSKKTLNKFNDLSLLLSPISPKAREAVAKYPKGTFKRINRIYTEPATGKKHIIAYEGIKVNFDLTSEGLVLPKERVLVIK